MTSTLPPTLATPRLRLRAPRVDDASAIFVAYTQDPEVCRYMVWTPHVKEDDTRAFLASCVAAWQRGDRLPYVLTTLTDDTPLGMLEVRFPSSHTIDLGYVLARAHWGQGLMPEAVQALAGVALGLPAIFRVQATCDVENVGSQRTLEKAGFVREGRLARHTVHPNVSPEPRACYLYARCR